MLDPAPHIGRVATALLGKPSSRSKTELRFGSHGSLAVDLTKGSFFDHERNAGGGVIDLIIRERGGSAQDALDWLRNDIGIDLDEGESRPNGHARASKPTAQAAPRIVASYVYRNAEGEPVYRVVRYEPKTFRQERYDAAKHEFIRARGCMEGVELLPYRLDEWLPETSATILIVEGEKDVDRLFAIGHLATCNPGGAGKWPDSFAEHFHARDILILPDNDEAGRRHAAVVAHALRPGASQVRVLELRDLPAKGDVSDWLDAGHTAEELEREVGRAKPVDDDTLARLSKGDPPAQPFVYVSVFAVLEQLSPQPFLVERWVPTGYLTSLYGSGGTGKSFLAMMLGICVAAGRPWLGYAVEQCNVLGILCEDDTSEITRRLKKICCGLAVQPQDLEGRLHLTSRVGELNALMEFPGGVAKRTPLFDRIIAEAERTASRLVILDNAGQFYAGQENAREQVTPFLNTCTAIAQAINGGVLLLGHPPKAPGMQYSGSTAWDAVPRSRMWFKRQEDDQDAYTLEVAKTNADRMFGIKLRINALGLVENVGDMDPKKRGRPSNASKSLNILEDLYGTHRRAIHIDELIKEAICRGVLEEAEELTERWRKRRLTMRSHLAQFPSVDQRNENTYALKP